MHAVTGLELILLILSLIRGHPYTCTNVRHPRWTNYTSPVIKLTLGSNPMPLQCREQVSQSGSCGKEVT